MYAIKIKVNKRIMFSLFSGNNEFTPSSLTVSPWTGVKSHMGDVITFRCDSDLMEYRTSECQDTMYNDNLAHYSMVTGCHEHNSHSWWRVMSYWLLTSRSHDVIYLTTSYLNTLILWKLIRIWNANYVGTWFIPDKVGCQSTVWNWYVDHII